jgi:hypothetical protein
MLTVGAVFVGLFVCSQVRASPMVHFDNSTYTVSSGGTFSVQILLDMDSTTAGDQVSADGLLSMGFKITYPGAKAEVTDSSVIVLPAELNSDGLGGAAPKSFGAGYAGAAGALSLSATSGYKNPLLATVTIHDLAPANDSFTLTLGKYYSPGDNFVQYGQRQNFDSSIGFGTATVNVVPEPTTITLLGLGWIILSRRRVRQVRSTGRPNCADSGNTGLGTYGV